LLQGEGGAKVPATERGSKRWAERRREEGKGGKKKRTEVGKGKIRGKKKKEGREPKRGGEGEKGGGKEEEKNE